MNSQDAFLKQSKTIEKYQKAEPELLQHPSRRSENEVFQEIGIKNIPEKRQEAYIRLFPQDFIVEEVSRDGTIVPIKESKVEEGEKSNTLYVKLLKIGIPTNVAIQRIAEKLGINYGKIGFSGLKDAGAITTQALAFPNLELQPDDLYKLNDEVANVYLSSAYYGSGSLNAGDLYGNKFTLTIRTNGSINDAIIQTRAKTISMHGILNYFHTQRFGGLRLLSHKLGMLLLRGEHETLIRYFLFKKVTDDITLIANIRSRAEKHYPDWTKIKEVFEELPYSFYNEIRLLTSLEEDKDNYVKALTAIQDQTQLWAYAYASWLFNEYISDYAMSRGLVDEEFPLLLSDRPQDFKIYKKFLKRDNTESFIKHLRPFKFIPLKKRTLAGRVVPHDINFRNFAGGVVMQFTLPKGAYATTFLINLFELYQGLPIPEWVSTEEIDPLRLYNNNNMEWIKERFSEYNFGFKADIVKSATT